MSEIDRQNAKQIRDPMDVLIEMELATDDVPLTYSGYSSAKVADGKLDEPTWPMRKLADLQGDGFSLDGEHVLYDSSTAPSQTNGKLGVRGNIGETVSVTIAGNKSITSLFIVATGAESVTYGSTTTPIYNNVVTIPVGATSITVTLNPASEADRIEVSQVEAGTKFRVTNENLIRATVSLRSDLSIIEPTLPESEINIEVYQDTDISEAVATIPENTPITYSAGYPGDMSMPRKFYVSGQVTWTDSILTIHGVDAVHFLNKTLATTLVSDTYAYNKRYVSTLYDSRRIARYILGDAGIEWDQKSFPGFHSGNYPENTMPESTFGGGVSYREILAQLMNLLHIDGIPEEYSSAKNTSFWFTYVDAGNPVLSAVKPTPMWTINEEDTGGHHRHVEPPISAILVKHWTETRSSTVSSATKANLEVGSIEWRKGEGAFVSLDDDVVKWTFGLSRADGVIPKLNQDNILPIIPTSREGFNTAAIAPDVRSGTSPFNGAAGSLVNSDTPQKEWDDLRYSGTVYTQVVPWSVGFSPGTSSYYRWQTQEQAWAELTALGLIPVDADSATLKIYGVKILKADEDVIYEANRPGITVSVDGGWSGNLWFCNSSTQPTKTEEAMPKWGYKSLFNRSNITGSFRWKGDPRQQPRDVATLVLMDGTEKAITLENITLVHEGGGTYADITYREGIV